MRAASTSAHSDRTRKFYDRLSRVYDWIADASEQASRERGIRALALARGERVLEIGCGTGHGLVAIANVIGPSGRACGVDISGGMIAVARRQLAERHQPSVTVVQGDARALCFRAESFDAAFLSFTLELFDAAIPIVLREVRRVLRTGGRIGVVGLAPSPDPGSITDVYVWLHRHVPHLVDCAPTDIAQAVADGGFSVEQAVTTSMWTLPVAVVIGRKITAWRPHGRSPHFEARPDAA